MLHRYLKVKRSKKSLLKQSTRYRAKISCIYPPQVPNYVRHAKLFNFPMLSHPYSFTFSYIHLPSSTYISHHLYTFVIIYIHWRSFTFIYHHLGSFSFIYLHLRSFTLIFFHLPSFTFIYLHLPSFTFIYVHLSPSTLSIFISFIYVHLFHLRTTSATCHIVFFFMST